MSKERRKINDHDERQNGQHTNRLHCFYKSVTHYRRKEFVDVYTFIISPTTNVSVLFSSFWFSIFSYLWKFSGFLFLYGLLGRDVCATRPNSSLISKFQLPLAWADTFSSHLTEAALGRFHWSWYAVKSEPTCLN